MKNFGMAECPICHQQFTKRSGGHTYCDVCKPESKRLNMERWLADNPDKKREHSRASAARAYARREDQVGAISETIKEEAWGLTREVTLLWYVRLQMPFSSAFSKNRIYQKGSENKPFVKSSAGRAASDEVIIRARNALRLANIRPVEAKVWVDLFVQKAEHRGDAVNVVDLVCDALKVALDVDDRWFSIRRLDWSVVRNDPMLYIGMGQETDRPHKICSICKRCLPFESFPPNKARPDALHNACMECRELGKVRQ